MKRLRFDYNKATRLLETHALHLVNEIVGMIHAEIYMNLTGGARNDIYADYSNVISEGHIRAMVVSNAAALAQSYGTGKGIDTSSPFLDYYMKSDLWNRLRQSTTVVGREEGSYNSMFGKKESTGSMAGSEIPFNSITATHAIQDVEDKWFNKDLAGKMLHEGMDEFIRKNATRFFRYG